MARRPSARQRGRPRRLPETQNEKTRRNSESLLPLPEPTLRRHFVRIILEEVIQDKKLPIPLRLFNTRIGRTEQLSDVVTLSVPNGHEWRVKVNKDEDHIWFVDGWSNFVKENGICDKFLLNFEYVGNSNFKVIIFDPTTFEISEYGKKLKQEQITESDDIIEISALDQTPKAKMHTSPLKHKSKNADNKEKVRVFCNNRYKKCIAKASDRIKKAALAADMYRPKNTAFKVLLQDYVKKKKYLIVPQDFATYYKKISENKINEEATLICPDRRQFKLKVINWGKSRNFILAKKWDEFSQYLHLKIGDIVMFELIHSCTFAVQVFPS